MVEHGDGGALSACDPIRRDAADHVQPLEFVGPVPFKPLEELQRADFLAGLCNKVLGQVEIVRQGILTSRMADRSPFTTGVVGREPVRTGASAALVNGALESAHRAAGSTRVPQHFPGFIQIAAATVAETFVKSIEGAQTGRIYIVEEPVPGFVAGRERARRPSAKLRRPAAASAPEGPQAPRAGRASAPIVRSKRMVLAAIPIRSGRRLTRHSQTLLIPMGQIAGCLGRTRMRPLLQRVG